MSGYKAFPPGRGHLQIPVSSRGAALAGLSLYAPCRPRAIWLRDACWFLVSRLGAWSLPGRRRPVVPPLERQQWSDFLDHVRREVVSFDDLALYHRSQRERPGFMALLIEAGAPRAFLKVGPSGNAELAREHRAVEAVERYGPRTFAVPAVLGASTYGEFSVLAFSALDAVTHKPAARAPIREIATEVSDALGSLPKPAATPAHWRPSHGDLTPWNLRERERGVLTLVDWEGAEWAPPGADEVLYHVATNAVLGASERPAGDTAEARTFWRDRLAERGGGERDTRLARAMIAELDSMG